MKKISEKIRLLRCISGYPQEYVAYLLGISQSAYSRQERGETNMSIKQLEKIGAIYSLSVTDLLDKHTKELLSSISTTH